MTQPLQQNGKDPTSNARELVESSIKRLDDLRESEIRRVEDKFKNIDDKSRDYDIKYQIQFDDSKEAVLAALTATKEAINKADQANEKRFDAVNEFRSTLSDQQSKLLNRTEYESNHAALVEKIDGVESRINRTEGASNIYVTHTDLSIFGEKLQAGFEAALKPLILQVNTLTAAQNSQQGGKEGVKNVWGYVVGAVGLTSAIIAIVMTLVNN